MLLSRSTRRRCTVGAAIVAAWALSPASARPSEALPAPQVQGPLPDEWYDDDEWHLLVRYIITPRETAEYRRLKTAGARDAFISAFWARRDPTPNAAPNEFREEFDRRVAFANAHFTNPDDAPHTGLETDRGRIYILFGPPDNILTFPSGAFELWRYSRHAVLGDTTLQFSIPPISSCDGSFRVVGADPIATARQGTTSVEIFSGHLVTARIGADFTRASSIAHTLRTASGEQVLEADAAFWDGQIGPAGNDPLSRHILGCRMFESGGMGFTHPLPPGSYTFSSVITNTDGAVRKETVQFEVR